MSERRAIEAGRVRGRVMTPVLSGGAAISIVQLIADDEAALDAALERLHLGRHAVGQVKLRPLPGGDRGLVIRWSPTCLQLFPHGGRMVLSSMRTALVSAGVELSSGAGDDPRNAYPEAGNLVEACALETIARSASPRAIDALLRQRDRWCDSEPLLAPSAESDRIMNRLVEPPLVVLVGAPNVGKSTLTNALARRAVSIVSETPGTTRDHVGVLLEVDGLVVRWVDAPGFRRDVAGAIERDAIELARSVAAQADLVIECRAAGSPEVHLELGATSSRLRLGTKADQAPPGRCDLSISPVTGLGMSDLAPLVRGVLTPDSALEAARRWCFHPLLSEFSEPSGR